MTARIDPRLTALERLTGRIKQLTSIGISLDGCRRWGSGPDSEFEAFAQQELADRGHVMAELETLIQTLRTEAPDVMATWAQAHIELLEDYLTRVDAGSTKAFVAENEMKAWSEVRAGTRDFVEENPVYVKPDPETYARLFGCPLPTFYW